MRKGLRIARRHTDRYPGAVSTENCRPQLAPGPCAEDCASLQVGCRLAPRRRLRLSYSSFSSCSPAARQTPRIAAGSTIKRLGVTAAGVFTGLDPFGVAGALMDDALPACASPPSVTVRPRDAARSPMSGVSWPARKAAEWVIDERARPWSRRRRERSVAERWPGRRFARPALERIAPFTSARLIATFHRPSPRALRCVCRSALRRRRPSADAKRFQFPRAARLRRLPQARNAHITSPRPLERARTGHVYGTASPLTYPAIGYMGCSRTVTNKSLSDKADLQLHSCLNREAVIGLRKPVFEWHGRAWERIQWETQICPSYLFVAGVIS